MKHPFAELIGLVFENWEKGESFCRLEVTDKLFNPLNTVHGGVMYSLADTGMGGALYPTLNKGELCATIEIKINYFKPVRKGTIECRSKIINRGKTVATLESEIFNHSILVAKASGSFSIFTPGKE